MYPQHLQYLQNPKNKPASIIFCHIESASMEIAIEITRQPNLAIPQLPTREDCSVVTHVTIWIE